MPRSGNSALMVRQPAALLDTSPESNQTNSEIGEALSCYLDDDEWDAIADSLGLSDRQLEVVQCVFDGLDEPSIGKKLAVSTHTIHTHLNRLYKKIRVKNRCELIVRVFLAYL